MLTALLAILLAVIALLAIPFTLKFRLAWPEVADNDIRLQWAFGLVRARIPTAGGGQAAGQAGKKRVRPGRDGAGKRNVFAAVRVRKFRRRLVRFVGQLWRAVRKQEVRVRMRAGLGDPADTGQLWAVLGPVSGLLANVQDASIRLEPEFVEAALELDSAGTIRVIPLQILYLFMALLLSPAVWQGLYLMRKGG